MRANEHKGCGCISCTTGLRLEDIAHVLALHLIAVSGDDDAEMNKNFHAFGMLLISEIMRLSAGHDGEPLQ
jgi:hypothetical protein